jgi:hypothetical protein
MFTEDEKTAAERLYRALAGLQKNKRMLRDYVGYAEETWEPITHYEKAKVFCREIKQMILEAGAQGEEMTEEAYTAIGAKWPLDEMDEEELEEYK